MRNTVVCLCVNRRQPNSMKIRIVFFFCTLIPFFSFAQEHNLAALDVRGKDTVPTVTLGEVRVFSRQFSSHEDRLAFERLKKNTYKVYPYVQTAVQIYYEMQNDLAEMDKKREKKRYINAREAELREKFEKEIRNLTKSQGQVLIKLINRETGNNCYAIVKDMKGPVVAFFWNIAGKMYDHNLKEEYKPEENKDLEFIVRMIKNEPLPGE